jgi:hypothetical protein
MLALLERQAILPGAAADHGTPPAHPAATQAQEAWNAAKLAGAGLLGGLFFWAKPAGQEEPETIDREKLARLDEKLRSRRYKNWDDVMRG